MYWIAVKGNSCNFLENLTTLHDKVHYKKEQCFFSSTYPQLWLFKTQCENIFIYGIKAYLRLAVTSGGHIVSHIFPSAAPLHCLLLLFFFFFCILIFQMVLHLSPSSTNISFLLSALISCLILLHLFPSSEIFFFFYFLQSFTPLFYATSLTVLSPNCFLFK